MSGSAVEPGARVPVAVFVGALMIQFVRSQKIELSDLLFWIIRF
jgi:hypothetical protein